MDRPDLDAIEGRLRDIPTCPLYRATAGGLGHPKGLLIWMDDAGDGRFVATVNNNHGDYAGLFANAPTDLAALLTYARALETILDGIQRITPGHGWIVDEQRRGVVPYPDMVRAISTEMEALRADRDRLTRTLACERGEIEAADAAHPADITFAILRFATVSREHPHYHLPAFLAGYLCAALDVTVDLRFGRCGTHQDSFRVGHREGAAALAIYGRKAPHG